MAENLRHYDRFLPPPSSGPEAHPSFTPGGFSQALPQTPNQHLYPHTSNHDNQYSSGYPIAGPISPDLHQHSEQSMRSRVPSQLSYSPYPLAQYGQLESPESPRFESPQYGSTSPYASATSSPWPSQYHARYLENSRPSFPPSPLPHYLQRNDYVSAFSGPQMNMSSQYSGDESSSPRPLSLTSEDSNDNIRTRARLGLDQRYAVIPKARAFFKFGRVFKTLWTEPAGGGVTRDYSTALSKVTYGEFAFSKIRRFVVVRESKHHSICLPIQTYQGKGTAKRGVSPRDHAVIFTGNLEPQLHPQETQLEKQAIGVTPATPSERLDPMSRVNFSKFYTVEHTVKVCNIGKVAPQYVHRLERYFMQGLAPNIHSLSRSPERPHMDHRGYIHPIEDQEDLVFSDLPPKALDLHDSDTDRKYSRKPRATRASGRRNTSPSPSYTPPRNQFDRRRNTSPTLQAPQTDRSSTYSTEQSRRDSSYRRAGKGKRK